jgi:hypothetical protein
MTNESKQITAKFTGKCARCGGVIPSGTRCEWEKGVGVRHIFNANVEGFGCPVQPAAANAPKAQQDKHVTVTMGVFKKDGHIYVVKPNKEKTRVYAKEIVESPARMTENGAVADFTTVYRAGVIFSLTEADRWDLADAKDFLTKFARCIVCGRHLKAAKSVAGSIGPVCAKYFAHSNACDDKPTTTIKAVKAQAQIDTEDQQARNKIASEIEIEDEGQRDEASETRMSVRECSMLAEDARKNAQLNMTDDQKALLDELQRLNAESRRWMAAGPDRFAGILTEDISYWASGGIVSVADLQADQAANDAKEARKESYYID